MAIDSITLELLQEKLISVVREMRANLVATAYSSIIQEAHDFSCVLVNGKGEIVAQAEDNPSHIFPIPWSVRQMFENFPDNIFPGDVFLHNDPYTGGTHLNDIAMIFPVFAEGKLELFPVVRAHWGDVGGTTPGSISGTSTEIFHDGIRIPILKIANKGTLDRAVLDLLFANMRVPEERHGDFMSTWGTCKVAETRILEIFEKYSLPTVVEGIQSLLSRTEKRMRDRIAALPDGEYVYEHYLDPPRQGLEPVKTRTTLSIHQDSIHIDFTGSSPQVPGPGNSGPANTMTGAFIVLKTFLDPDHPINHGNFMPIEVKIPSGSFLNARYPASCAGSSEVRNAAISSVLGAMGQVIPETMAGDIKGTSNHTYIAGNDRRTGKPFLFYEYPAGGTGGTSENDGNNAVRNFAEGDFSSIQPAEAVEHYTDLLVERCEIRTDSCGPGFHRGGFGLRRDLRLLAETGLLSIASDKNVIPPFGVNDGMSGSPNEFRVIRNGKEILPSDTPGKVAGFRLEKGDVVSLRSSGGGGWGDPLTRDTDDVLLDYQNGYLTADAARSYFGVVLSGESLDLEATTSLRELLRNNRLFLQIQFEKEPSDETKRRTCTIAPRNLQQFGLNEGDLIEVISPHGLCLRSWLSTSQEVSENIAFMGSLSQKILQALPNDKVEIRSIKRNDT